MTVRVIIDDSGAITIPQELREACGFRADDEVVLETVDQGILLRRTTDLPVELYSDDRIAEFTSDEEAVGRWR